MQKKPTYKFFSPFTIHKKPMDNVSFGFINHPDLLRKSNRNYILNIKRLAKKHNIQFILNNIK
jgi:hypothetical protein